MTYSKLSLLDKQHHNEILMPKSEVLCPLSPLKRNSRGPSSGMIIRWKVFLVTISYHFVNGFRNTLQGVLNGLCEHLRACKQCIYFCKYKQLSIFSCEQWAL